MTRIAQKTVENIVYGSAFADAWGYVTEFVEFKNIRPYHLEPPLLLRVSDDTQMSIYTMLAIDHVARVVDLKNVDIFDENVSNQVRKIIADYYVEYFYDKDNTRHPGETVMTALELYVSTPRANRVRGDEGSYLNNSQGCGTIMRTGWLGLLDLPEETIFWLSCVSSQITHGNPLSWLSAGVHAINVHRLAYGTAQDIMGVDEILGWLHVMESIDSSIYHDSFEPYVEAILREDVENKILRFVNAPSDHDVCSYLGQGWVGHETLWCAMGAWYKHKNDSDPFGQGVKTLVHSNGDSDSLAQVGSCYLATLTNDNLRNLYGHRFEPRYRDELAYIIDIINRINK